MGAKVGTDKAFDDMNLTPLIDVVLVVLIIMMVSIPIQVQEMGVKVPDPNAPPPPKTDTPPEQLVISIYEDGSLALNRRLMQPQKISFELNRRIRGMSKKNVFIDAAVTTPYSTVVDMIDLARNEGAVKVGLAKVKEGGPLPHTSVDSGALPRGLFIGSPIVNGMITEKKADAAIQAVKGGIMNCYSTALASSPTATGRMMLTVKFMPEGNQPDADGHKISGSSMEGVTEAFDTCVLEQLQTVTSAPLGEGNTAAVTYPIIFSPG